MVYNYLPYLNSNIISLKDLTFKNTVLNVTIILLIVLISMAIIYAFLVLRNVRKRKYLYKMKPIWYGHIFDYVERRISMQELKQKCDRNRHFRDFIIDLCRSPKFEKEELRKIYSNFGFLEKEMKVIDKKDGLKAANALWRWQNLEISLKENFILKLLDHKEKEVRLAALDYLSKIKSPLLNERMKDIFDKNSENLYEYLIVKLFTADIPVRKLSFLVDSEDKRMRKAAAKLLGKEGEKDAIKYLKKYVDMEEPELRVEAVKSLERIDLDGCTDVLRCFSKDENCRVRVETARALGNIRNDGSLEVLNELAEDQRYQVRLNALLSLSKYGVKGKKIIQNYLDQFPTAARESLMSSVLGGD
ncbi:MAG: HEAT repeat domain-containing protein [Thermoplasmata archaeon]